MGCLFQRRGCGLPHIRAMADEGEIENERANGLRGRRRDAKMQVGTYHGVTGVSSEKKGVKISVQMYCCPTV